MGGLFAHRDARIYLAAQSLSIIGDSSIWLAMGIYAKILTGSNGDAGLTFLAFICGSLLAPVHGVIVDRMRRRTLLIWANIIGAAEVCLLLTAGPHRAWVIYPVMFGYGAVGSLILTAQTALLPAMLPDDLLGQANTVLQVAEQGFRIFTPLIGAGLLALVGPAPVILLDAGTFLVAALALMAIRLREPKPEPSGEHWRAEFTAGMRFIGRTPLLRRLLTAGVIALLVFGIFQSVQYAVVDAGLHRSPPFLGVLEAATGVGAITGGVAAAVLIDKLGERWFLVGGLAAMAVACAPMLMTGQLAVVLVAMGLFGAGLLSVNVSALTLIQRHTPSELLGRVDATVNLAVLVPQAVSIAVGAVLVSVVDYRLLLLFMGVGIAISAAWMISMPKVTSSEPDAQPGTAAPLAVSEDG